MTCFLFFKIPASQAKFVILWPNHLKEKGRFPKAGIQYFQPFVRSGLNSHYFHIIGDGHQPNSRGLCTHYKDSLLKVG